MKIAIIGKDTYLIRIHTAKYILILGMCRILISLIGSCIYRLGITKTIHKEYNLLLDHLLLFKHGLLAVLNDSSSQKCIFLLNIVKILFNDLHHGSSAAEYIFIFSNLCQSLLIFLLKCHYLKTEAYKGAAPI